MEKNEPELLYKILKPPDVVKKNFRRSVTNRAFLPTAFTSTPYPNSEKRHFSVGSISPLRISSSESVGAENIQESIEINDNPSTSKQALTNSQESGLSVPVVGVAQPQEVNCHNEDLGEVIETLPRKQKLMVEDACVGTSGLEIQKLGDDDKMTRSKVEELIRTYIKNQTTTADENYERRLAQNDTLRDIQDEISKISMKRKNSHRIGRSRSRSSRRQRYYRRDSSLSYSDDEHVTRKRISHKRNSSRLGRRKSSHFHYHNHISSFSDDSDDSLVNKEINHRRKYRYFNNQPSLRYAGNEKHTSRHSSKRGICQDREYQNLSQYVVSMKKKHAPYNRLHQTRRMKANSDSDEISFTDPTVIMMKRDMENELYNVNRNEELFTHFKVIPIKLYQNPFCSDSFNNAAICWILNNPKCFRSRLVQKTLARHPFSDIDRGIRKMMADSEFNSMGSQKLPENYGVNRLKKSAQTARRNLENVVAFLNKGNNMKGNKTDEVNSVVKEKRKHILDSFLKLAESRPLKRKLSSGMIKIDNTSVEINNQRVEATAYSSASVDIPKNMQRNNQFSLEQLDKIPSNVTNENFEHVHDVSNTSILIQKKDQKTIPRDDTDQVVEILPSPAKKKCLSNIEKRATKFIGSQVSLKDDIENVPQSMQKEDENNVYKVHSEQIVEMQLFPVKNKSSTNQKQVTQLNGSHISTRDTGTCIEQKNQPSAKEIEVEIDGHVSVLSDIEIHDCSNTPDIPSGERTRSSTKHFTDYQPSEKSTDATGSSKVTTGCKTNSRTRKSYEKTTIEVGKKRDISCETQSEPKRKHIDKEEEVKPNDYVIPITQENGKEEVKHDSPFKNVSICALMPLSSNNTPAVPPRQITLSQKENFVDSSRSVISESVHEVNKAKPDCKTDIEVRKTLSKVRRKRSDIGGTKSKSTRKYIEKDRIVEGTDKFVPVINKNGKGETTEPASLLEKANISGLMPLSCNRTFDDISIHKTPSRTRNFTLPKTTELSENVDEIDKENINNNINLGIRTEVRTKADEEVDGSARDSESRRSFIEQQENRNNILVTQENAEKEDLSTFKTAEVSDLFYQNAPDLSKAPKTKCFTDPKIPGTSKILCERNNEEKTSDKRQISARKTKGTNSETLVKSDIKKTKKQVPSLRNVRVSSVSHGNKPSKSRNKSTERKKAVESIEITTPKQDEGKEHINEVMPSSCGNTSSVSKKCSIEGRKVGSTGEKEQVNRKGKQSLNVEMTPQIQSNDTVKSQQSERISKSSEIQSIDNKSKRASYAVLEELDAVISSSENELSSPRNDKSAVLGETIGASQKRNKDEIKSKKVLLFDENVGQANVPLTCQSAESIQMIGESSLEMMGGTIKPVGNFDGDSSGYKSESVVRNCANNLDSGINSSEKANIPADKFPVVKLTRLPEPECQNALLLRSDSKKNRSKEDHETVKKAQECYKETLKSQGEDHDCVQLSTVKQMEHEFSSPQSKLERTTNRTQKPIKTPIVILQNITLIKSRGSATSRRSLNDATSGIDTFVKLSSIKAKKTKRDNKMTQKITRDETTSTSARSKDAGLNSEGVRKSTRERKPPPVLWWKPSLTEKDTQAYGYLVCPGFSIEKKPARRRVMKEDSKKENKSVQRKGKSGKADTTNGKTEPFYESGRLGVEDAVKKSIDQPDLSTSKKQNGMNRRLRPTKGQLIEPMDVDQKKRDNKVTSESTKTEVRQKRGRLKEAAKINETIAPRVESINKMIIDNVVQGATSESVAREDQVKTTHTETVENRDEGHQSTADLPQSPQIEGDNCGSNDHIGEGGTRENFITNTPSDTVSDLKLPLREGDTLSTFKLLESFGMTLRDLKDQARLLEIPQILELNRTQDAQYGLLVLAPFQSKRAANSLYEVIYFLIEGSCRYTMEDETSFTERIFPVPKGMLCTVQNTSDKETVLAYMMSSNCSFPGWRPLLRK